jgi:hypothetical protein
MRHRPRTSFSKYDANKSVDPASRSEGDRADAELLLATEQSNQETFFSLPDGGKSSVDFNYSTP